VRKSVLYLCLTLSAAVCLGARPAIASIWAKGNLHTHTTNSDGDSSPQVVANWYKDHGYQFLVITDHGLVTDVTPLDTDPNDDFILISGEELSISFQTTGIHSNAVGIAGTITYTGPTTSKSVILNGLVNCIRGAGGVPMVNHPNWKWAFGHAELLEVNTPYLLEIFNGGPSVNNSGNAAYLPVEQTWDVLLSKGKTVYATATDDAHTFTVFKSSAANPGRGWVFARVTEVTPQAAISALSAGDFYASTGVELVDYSFSGGLFQVHVAPKPDNTYLIRFVGDWGSVLQETSGTSAMYDALSAWPCISYVRCKVISSSGEVAWTQAYRIGGTASPGPVRNFTAIGGGQQVNLSWTNPSDPVFTGTMIRYSTAGYPSSPTSGALLIDKPNSPGSIDTYVHTGLTNGTTYYYSAFTHDGVPNYAPAAQASAPPESGTCFYEGFSCSDGPPVGCNGWTGTSSSKITISAQALKILGGAGVFDAVHTLDCGDFGTGVIAVDVKIKKGVGANTIWGLWIDDAAGANLAHWYGSGMTARGKIGATSSVTNLCSLTGNWDDLFVKIYPAMNRSQFFFNGAMIGTLDHSSTGAGDSVGRLRFESLDYSNAVGQYVWFDNLRVGLADDGSIPSIRQLANDTVVSLGNKALFLKKTGYGYVEASNRTSGIRVEGTISANEGDLVCLTGTIKTTAGGERYIQLGTMSTPVPGSVKPVAASNRNLKTRVMDGLYVKTWGTVKPGSITGNSFVVTDGSDETGITIITTGAPGVVENEFVKVEGAAGWESARVLYLKQ